MPSNTFKLYVRLDTDYDAVIAKYRCLCEEGVSFYEGDVTIDGKDNTTLVYKKPPRKPLMDDTRIRNKAMYLMHTIVYRQMTSRENHEDGASLQASVLQAVLKDDYFEILKAFVVLGYVQQSSVYIVGKSSRRYKAIGVFSTEQCSNLAIKKYINHTKQLLEKQIEDKLSSTSFKNEYGDDFAGTYIKNLNKFKIVDMDGFIDFANDKVNKNPDTEAYYDFVKSSFNSKLKIYRIDNNNRIYHILTSLKRELKEYINIKFSIDCSNSHPLLFNYFIYRYNNISIKDSYKISNILYNTSSSLFYNISQNIHYDIPKLRNILINNKINEEVLLKLSDDELLYLWKTTNGVFWDDILSSHQGLDRTDVKKKMFGEVFYSKTTETWWKKFAKEFEDEYPNVYSLIEKWKTPRKYHELSAILIRRKKAVEIAGYTLVVGNDDTALPNLMMDLESTIFKIILQNIYKNGVAAVHIHDAIVVPSISSTEKVSSDSIK